jgi:hypothetical protein
MDETNQTQKEVGRKYRDNLGYFKYAGFLHREKFYLSILAVLVGVYGIIRLELSRSDKVYNPAPLSISHANLEGNCAACHTLAARNIFHPMLPAGGNDSSVALPVAFSSTMAINESCQKCHQGMDLHQPTSQTMQLRAFHSELHVVAATGCFDCHQEHLGRINMRLPGDSACAACHDDAAKMAANFTRISLGGTTSRLAFDGMTPDGVLHFIPPERKGPLPLFTAFERGHPPFEYEQPGLKDPDVLTFSHRQHLTLPGTKLECADCHKPAADGMYYQRVTYEAACERCHTLQFDPANPQLMIPHGDVARLRTFLHSLTYQYSQLDQQMATAQNRVASPDEQRAYAFQQIFALMQRAHVQSPADLEHEILFTGDPYKDRPPTMQRPFFSGCAYCHQVTQPAGGGDPIVTPPQTADRWLAHGAFTHAKHTFMSCVQCHAANESREASDIIMPPQVSCIACHRTNGTAPSNCLACHSFHSPQSVVKTVKALWDFPKSADCPVTGQMSGFLVSERKPNE